MGSNQISIIIFSIYHLYLIKDIDVQNTFYDQSQANIKSCTTYYGESTNYYQRVGSKGTCTWKSVSKCIARDCTSAAISVNIILFMLIFSQIMLQLDLDVFLKLLVIQLLSNKIAKKPTVVLDNLYALATNMAQIIRKKLFIFKQLAGNILFNYYINIKNQYSEIYYLFDQEDKLSIDLFVEPLAKNLSANLALSLTFLVNILYISNIILYIQQLTLKQQSFSKNRLNIEEDQLTQKRELTSYESCLDCSKNVSICLRVYQTIEFKVWLPLIFCFCENTFYSLQQSFVGLIEKFSKYHTSLPAGLNQINY